MGVCDSSTEENRNRSRTRNAALNTKLRQADENSSRMEDEREKYTDRREEILRYGSKKDLLKLIDEYSDNINEYIFEQSKTLLIKACIICPKPEFIDWIMKKNPDINYEEYHTKNTAIFFAAEELKVEFVKKLKENGADLMKRNKDNLTVEQFMKKEWVENKGREMSPEEKRKYSQIMDMIGTDDKDND